MSKHSSHRTIAVVVVAVLLGVASAGAQGAPPQGRRANGRPPGPPPVAVAACAGSEEGDACAFTGLYGEHIGGTCAPIGEQLACLPDDAPPPPRPGQE